MQVKGRVDPRRLHISAAPRTGQRAATVLAVLRARRRSGAGGTAALPGLRSALAGIGPTWTKKVLRNENPSGPVTVPAALTRVADGRTDCQLTRVDLLESARAPAGDHMDDLRLAPGPGRAGVTKVSARHRGPWRVLEFAATEVVPRLARTTDEVTHLLDALDGRYVPAGPSGSPTRGLVNVLPTGRNFYSVDPKAIPSRNAWATGSALADSLLARHLADTGSYPRAVGLTVWGTSAMRTQGDDIAEVLALIGCEPTWDDASRRVTGFAVVPLEKMGAADRVTVPDLRFPGRVPARDRAAGRRDQRGKPGWTSRRRTIVRAHTGEELAAHGDHRRATTGSSRSSPAGTGWAYCADGRMNWRTDADLAEVLHGVGRLRLRARAGRPGGAGGHGGPPASGASRCDQNTDAREHDIAGSDYFQFHGVIVAYRSH